MNSINNQKLNDFYPAMQLVLFKENSSVDPKTIINTLSIRKFFYEFPIKNETLDNNSLNKVCTSVENFVNESKINIIWRDIFSTYTNFHFFEKANYTDNFKWVLNDKERVKLLLESKNLDLTKLNFDRTLLELSIWSQDLEIFSMIWNRSSEKDKSNFFLKCMELKRNNYYSFPEYSVMYDKTIRYLIDNKKISPSLFTESEQHNILLFNYYSDDTHLIFIKDLLNLGFNINAKDQTGESRLSMLDRVSNDIFDLGLCKDRVSVNKHEEFILGQMNVLQMYFENFENKSSNTNPLKYDVSQFDTIVPYLTASKSSLTKAFADENVKISNILWDKATHEDRKETFQELISKKNSKTLISLMNDKKIFGGMFTANEQASIFYDLFFKNNKNRQYNDLDSECLHKLIESDFNINNCWGGFKYIRDRLLMEIEYSETDYEIKTLEALYKALEKQTIRLSTLLEAGRNDATSNLSMFPKDIRNEIINKMILLNK